MSLGLLFAAALSAAPLPADAQLNTPKIRGGAWQVHMISPEDLPPFRECLLGNIPHILRIDPTCRQQSYRADHDGIAMELACGAQGAGTILTILMSGDFSTHFRTDATISEDGKVQLHTVVEQTYIDQCSSSEQPIDG
jgi:hypothetical protein